MQILKQDEVNLVGGGLYCTCSIWIQQYEGAPGSGINNGIELNFTTNDFSEGIARCRNGVRALRDIIIDASNTYHFWCKRAGWGPYTPGDLI